MNSIVEQLTKIFNNEKKYSLISNAVIVFQNYIIDKDNRDDEGRIIPEFKTAYYNTSISEKLTSIPMIKQYAEEKVLMFANHLDSFIQNGSGWIFDKIIQLRIQVGKTKKKTAGYHVETPSVLANKKCLHNIKNLDDRCIDYCLVSHFFYDIIKSKDTTNTKKYVKYLEQSKIPKDQKYQTCLQTRQDAYKQRYLQRPQQ